MLNDSDKAKLEFIFKMISNIEIIIERHKGIDQTIEDLEGQNAILMCVLQIGETLNKLENAELRTSLPVKESYGLRNLIAHHYDSVDLSIISEILEYDIPELKLAIQNYL
jgi:uncharacterized protein with HEPN domain